MAARLPAGRRQAPKNDAPPREAVQGDNSMHGEEAERVTLLSFVSKIAQQDVEVERTKVPFDAAKKARTTTFRLANAAGISRKRIEARMAEMNGGREMAEEIRLEARDRRWLGILDDDQMALHLNPNTPEEVKDEAHWRSCGYRDGLRMKPNTAPPECGARFLQPYLEGHEKGFFEATAANAPKPIPPKPLTPAEQARADFEQDQKESQEAARAAKRLANDSTFMNRDGPDAEFEAPESELAAQIQRQAVVGGREQEDVV